jgi:hypothetical protein
MSEPLNQPATNKANPPATEAEVDALLDRAGRGDGTCLPELRALYSDPVRGARLVQQFGSPPHWLIETMVKNTAPKDLAVREAIRLKVDQVRREIEGIAPTPMERLLAERAAACWLQLNLYSTIYEQSKDLTIRQAEFQQRKIDGAHRRFLSAVRTLATVRKLALPNLQINVAQNQINVG